MIISWINLLDKKSKPIKFYLRRFRYEKIRPVYYGDPGLNTYFNRAELGRRCQFGQLVCLFRRSPCPFCPAASRKLIDREEKNTTLITMLTSVSGGGAG